MEEVIGGTRHADVPVSLRQVREEVRALREHLRARDIKDAVPQVREQESVPNTPQRFRGDLKEELKLKAARERHPSGTANGRHQEGTGEGREVRSQASFGAGSY